jgi:competence protein ComEC
VDILKVGHHGSRTASSAAFLDALKPHTAVYMCGLNNKHGHPHQETIDALNARGLKIYGTENYGTITITTDGKTYRVSTEKG